MVGSAEQLRRARGARHLRRHPSRDRGNPHDHRVKEFYRLTAIPADAVARAIAFAIEQPADVDINEILLRPTAQGL